MQPLQEGRNAAAEEPRDLSEGPWRGWQQGHRPQVGRQSLSKSLQTQLQTHRCIHASQVGVAGTFGPSACYRHLQEGPDLLQFQDEVIHQGLDLVSSG